MFLLRFQPLIFRGVDISPPKPDLPVNSKSIKSRVTVPFHSTPGFEHVQELLQKSPVMVCGVEKCSPLLKNHRSLTAKVKNPSKNDPWNTVLRFCGEGNISRGERLNFGGFLVYVVGLFGASLLVDRGEVWVWG